MTVLRDRPATREVSLERWPGLRSPEPAPIRAAAARQLMSDHVSMIRNRRVSEETQRHCC